MNALAAKNRPVIASWLKAFRLQTLPLAAAGILMGNFLAFDSGKFDFLTGLFALLTALFLQILSNIANDYGDAVHEVDTGSRVGPERMVHSGQISMRQMKKAVFVFVLLSFISGLMTLMLSLKNTGWIPVTVLFVLGLAAIWAAYHYTASDNPYGYRGWGDLFVFVFFGVLAVCGPYYLQTGSFDGWVLLPAFSVGFFSVAVLNINNIRDLPTDKETNKRTIPVRLGLGKAKLYHLILLFLGVMASSVYAAFNFKEIWQFPFLAVLLLFYFNGRGIWKGNYPRDFAPFLKQMALFTLVYTLCFGMSLLI